MTSLQELLAIADGDGPELPISGAELRELRTEASISPTTLAAVAGLSDRALVEFERSDNRRIRSDRARRRLAKVAHALKSVRQAT